MSHKVKTSVVILSGTIIPDNLEVWSGVGQVNSSTVPEWISIQASMLDLYSELVSKQLTLFCPTNKYKFNTVTIGYIYDNNLNITYKNKLPNEL